MLNALAGSQKAIVSKMPGRTQRINLFKVSDKKVMCVGVLVFVILLFITHFVFNSNYVITK
jgi:GTP-binding protein EngB required for normal cell division